MVDIDTLKQTEIFSGLEMDQLKKIQSCCQIKKFTAGDTIFHSGERAETLYVLLEGAVTTHFDDEAVGDVTLSWVAQNTSFGWSALVAPNQYTSNAFCQKDSKALAIGSACIHELMREDPGTVFFIMQNIIGTLSNRLKDARVQLYDALITVERLKDQKK